MAEGLNSADDELRHRIWQAEQDAIRERRDEAKRRLDGDPEARRALEARWAPVTDMPPTP